MHWYGYMLPSQSDAHSSAEHEDDEELAALANKLKAPMSAQGQRLKQYMMETILPVVQRVKQVHETLEDKGQSPCYLHDMRIDV